MKIGSGMHSDPKFGWREGGICYIDARKKSFWNGVPVRSVTIPLPITYIIYEFKFFCM
jgi:hypothetical protein